MTLRRQQARQQVVQTVLDVLSADLLPADTPHRALRVSVAEDQLELAARNLTRAVHASDPEDWPVGWASPCPKQQPI